MKLRRRPEVREGDAFMDRYGPLSASLRWLNCNVAMHHLMRDGVPGISMKYEELIARPYQELQRVVDHAGQPMPAALTTELIEGQRSPAQNHSIAGNPMRFDEGPLRLRLDDEWRAGMRHRDRLLVTALTGPMLWRYGYVDGARRGTGRAAAG
jgi:hypothetical protein